MTEEFRFDPRDLIMGPFEICPACGAEGEFGLLGVHGSSYTKRCRTCMETENFELPSLSKELIYLDQLAISHLAKSIHPDWRDQYLPGNPRTQDGFWLTAFEKLDRIQKLNLAACPESSVQRMESVLDSRLRDMLQTLYEHLSGQLHFQDLNYICDVQIAHALDAYLGESDFVLGARDQILRGDEGDWIDKLHISVDMGMHDLEVAETQRVRQQRDTQLQALFDDCARQPGRRYESFRDEYLEDPSRLLRGWRYGGLMHTIPRRMDEHGVAPEEQESVLGEFARSDQLRTIPSFRLKMCILAAFADEVAGERARRPNQGMWFDLQGVSAFLPYCEAIFVDRELARWLGVVADHGDLPGETKVFSIDTREEFIDYLDRIEADASPDHLRLVTRVYGDAWTEPFRELYEWRKEEDPER